MKRKSTVLIMLLFGIHSLISSQESNQILLSESFDELSDAWKKILLTGKKMGEVEVDNGKLMLRGGDGYTGIYYQQPVKGHFIVELDFVDDQNVGLALIQNKNGKPDLNNYTLLCVDTQAGNVVVYLRDCQNGKSNVLDSSGKTRFKRRRDEENEELNIGFDLYKHVLTGNQYSVPFTKTNKTIRIFRDDNADFFHYYYQVSKVYAGRTYVDWMELRPSPDWSEPGSDYFIGILSLHEGEIIINNLKAVRKPVQDQDDRSTGFKVAKREYNWSSFMGDGYVVTFDEAFPFREMDVKFVFWTEMNYIPAWQ